MNNFTLFLWWCHGLFWTVLIWVKHNTSEASWVTNAGYRIYHWRLPGFCCWLLHNCFRWPITVFTSITSITHLHKISLTMLHYCHSYHLKSQFSSILNDFRSICCCSLLRAWILIKSCAARWSKALNREVLHGEGIMHGDMHVCVWNVN